MPIEINILIVRMVSIHQHPYRNISFKILALSQSISKSLCKSHSLNHYLESHLHKNRFLYLFILQQFFYISCALQRVICIKTLSISFQSPTVFLYLMCTLESNSHLLFLASEKIEIEHCYIWITVQISCWRVVFHQNLYSYHLERIQRVSGRCSIYM